MIRSLLVSVALLSATVAGASGLPRYRLTDLGALPGDGTATAARAITANGLVVGEQFDPVTGYNRAVRLDAPSAYLPTLSGGLDTVPRGINAAGVVAATVAGAATDNDRAALITRTAATQLSGLPGYAAAGAFDVNDFGVATGYVLASGRSGVEGSLPITQNIRPEAAVVWVNGVPTALSGGGGAIRNSLGYAINDAGTVAGLARLADDSIRAVSWSPGGSLTILPIGPGQTRSVARAINARGDIAGQVSGAVTEATLWSGSTLYALGVTPDVVDPATRGLNDHGVVVGFGTRDFGNGDVRSIGEYWARSGGTYVNYELDSLVVNLGGWSTESAQGINDRGDIVGIGTGPDGSERAYQLSLVPEPGSWSLLFAGFALTGLVMRRRTLYRSRREAANIREV